MRRFVLAVAAFLAFAAPAIAQDVHVRGYTRADGTYVRPHVRSAPDQTRANNYGPSRTDSELLLGRSRDNDRDGLPNYLDNDDDNDAVRDDDDRSQYGRSSSYSYGSVVNPWRKR